jgi:hypothetical protein
VTRLSLAAWILFDPISRFDQAECCKRFSNPAQIKRAKTISSNAMNPAHKCPALSPKEKLAQSSLASEERDS